MKNNTNLITVMLVLFSLLSSCSPQPQNQVIQPVPSSTAALPTGATVSLSTATLQATDTATATSTPAPEFLVSTPLEEISLSELVEILKNPFQAPQPGRDDGHHGVDFAYYSRGSRTQMDGLGIHAVLSGRVAGVMNNRPPYGYAVIIETPLNHRMLEYSFLPLSTTTGINRTPDTRLFCPNYDDLEPVSSGVSIYTLYAHMLDQPVFSVGEYLDSGARIGSVGSTGASINAHLHLEMRMGPSGATFGEMAHYINDATDLEMATYCLWRVSGYFTPFDPMLILVPDNDVNSK